MRISDWSSDVCSSDLLPGCELNFSEHLGLESVIRAGVDESCASLSRGTQEQLAVLTRIALADMLLEQGKPVSLILDDPTVYSDDARLEIGRGSGRERGCQYVEVWGVGGSLKKKKKKT